MRNVPEAKICQKLGNKKFIIQHMKNDKVGKKLLILQKKKLQVKKKTGHGEIFMIDKR